MKRDGRVYTEIVPNGTKATPQAVIQGHIAPDTVISSDGWRGYDGLVDIGFDKHFRVNHSANEFARGKCHINLIESFWVMLNAGYKSSTEYPLLLSTCI